MKSSVFDNICNFAASGQYFTVLWKVIERKTWFVLVLRQNYPRASSFGGKRQIVNVANFCNFWFFWAILWVYFDSFLGSLMHPSYQNMNHPGLEYKPTNNQFYQLFLPFRLCYSQKSISDILRELKWPPEAQGFENFWIWCLTPKFTLCRWY